MGTEEEPGPRRVRALSPNFSPSLRASPTAPKILTPNIFRLGPSQKSLGLKSSPSSNSSFFSPKKSLNWSKEFQKNLISFFSSLFSHPARNNLWHPGDPDAREHIIDEHAAYPSEHLL